MRLHRVSDLVIFSLLVFVLQPTSAQLQYDTLLYNKMQWREIGPFRGGRSSSPDLGEDGSVVAPKAPRDTKTSPRPATPFGRAAKPVWRATRGSTSPTGKNRNGPGISPGAVGPALLTPCVKLHSQYQHVR